MTLRWKWSFDASSQLKYLFVSLPNRLESKTTPGLIHPSSLSPFSPFRARQTSASGHAPSPPCPIRPDVFPPLPTYLGFASSPWRSSRGPSPETLERSLEDLCLSAPVPRPPSPPPTPPHPPGFRRTLGPHRTQICSPDARGRALPGGVKDNLKTNGGASINT